MASEDASGEELSVSRSISNPGEKTIATNPIARSEYHLEELVEAGLVLQGTEVKSMRAQTPNLRDAYVEIRNGEAWLCQLHIPHYSHGNIWNHDLLRPRKLLLHARQVVQLSDAVQRGGKTIVPTRMYFLKGRVKVEIAIAKGKKQYDKREDIKRRDQDREMEQAIKQTRFG